VSNRHGSSVRGMENVPHSSVRDQRFGRMFRLLPPAPFTEAALVALGRTMFHGEFDERIDEGKSVDFPLNEREPEDENPDIPAGFTYLGQFIDHDITFDPASSLDRFNDPDALVDFRTPRLDLDAVYGSGPDDQPFMYDADGKHFLFGDDKDFDPRHKRPDLPRNTATPRRALIGDKRNDENVIVSQMHALFLRFHNAVLDMAAGGDFAEAQRIVRWHYQWIVLHDFIRKVVGDHTYGEVIRGLGQTPVLRFYRPKGLYAFIPVEFSVAAYRFGHSMVRPTYALNRLVLVADPREQPFHGRQATFDRIPIFSLVSDERGNLNGFREIPNGWAVDWSFFFDGVPPDGQPPDGAVLPQPAYKLDTILVDPLTSLPDHQTEPRPERRALAVLNLLRGWRLQLPSGQAVARKMGHGAMTDAEIFAHEDTERADARAAVLRQHPIFRGNAPLWFYILREAELVGGSAHLGPVGGTIVAEVLAGLIQEDRHSFLSVWPTWRPTLQSRIPNHFTMADLVNFTNQHG
jgi:Animal haem peroxidase